MDSLKLSEIWIYPIKSLGGISLSTSVVMPKGLKYDRRWMLVDEHNKFMTQRTHPMMSLFKLSMDKGSLVIQFQEEKKLLSFESTTFKSVQVIVWNDSVSAYEVSDTHSEWFSAMLNIKCKLVFFPESHARAVDVQYSIQDDHVSFADAFPFLIIGQESLNDLNTRLLASVPMDRFRPNFVFTGGKPYEEDTWNNFSIGASRFRAVKPCSRCIMTTVDQQTGEKGIEPLKTLATYRKHENKIYFGQNLIATDCNSVSLGDEIIKED